MTRWVGGFKLEHLNSIQEQGKKNKFDCNFMQKIARLSKLWIPINKQMILLGIQVGDEVRTDPTEMSTLLASSWQKTFDKKPIDIQEADKFLKETPELPSYDTATPPTVFTFHARARFWKNRAPGPDGLPFEAWRATGVEGENTLAGYSEHLHSGARPHKLFNSSLMTYPPKGVKEGDAVAIIRAAKETRPISLKNSDNKAITDANVSCFRNLVGKNTHHIQRGFVHGRNFLENVLELDSMSRIYSMFAVHNYGLAAFLDKPHLVPITPTFDFEAAFPSVAHEWIILVLRARGVPGRFVIFVPGVIRVILGSY